ncbi:hypothetical protein [Novosphingobium sp.]|uniref:hypothetical protein n=1 Tax=Novosphingobium sp. TaxID=1874826 RepID=UPI0025E3F273|nr:hypothetical protein [Novosphingobium sp.]
MDGDRTARAQARIEAALARIEASAHRAKGLGGGAAAPTGGAELAHLQARHDRLRAVVQDSLSQLDQIIESAEG